MLYCQLTRAAVNRVKTDVEKHLDGRRFKTKLYQQWRRAMLKRKKKLLAEIKIEDRLRERRIRERGIRRATPLLGNKWERLKRLTRWSILKIK